ncbi:hypothetical protein [Lysinibacillus xylanilyticus]|uniref:Uncharacterized protein n=1 Tax=Lysinibacillus xylanilyticus TaxID=582475 RepID=A0ABV3W261_9BACI
MLLSAVLGILSAIFMLLSAILGILSAIDILEQRDISSAPVVAAAPLSHRQNQVVAAAPLSHRQNQVVAAAPLALCFCKNIYCKV